MPQYGNEQRQKPISHTPRPEQLRMHPLEGSVRSHSAPAKPLKHSHAGTSFFVTHAPRPEQARGQRESGSPLHRRVTPATTCSSPALCRHDGISHSQGLLSFRIQFFFGRQTGVEQAGPQLYGAQSHRARGRTAPGRFGTHTPLSPQRSSQTALAEALTPECEIVECHAVPVSRGLPARAADGKGESRCRYPNIPRIVSWSLDRGQRPCWPGYSQGDAVGWVS